MRPGPALENRIKQVAEDYRQQGFVVEVDPRSDQLPDFLRGFAPDLLATREDGSVVVEIKRARELRGDDEVARLAAALQERPGWRFDLVTLADRRPAAKRDTPWLGRVGLDLPAIDLLLENATRAAAHEDDLSAITLAALGAEGLLNTLGNRTRGHKTLGPAALAKTLYSDGLLLDGDVDPLVELFSLRNAAVHGSAALPPVDLASLLDAVARIRDRERIRERIVARASNEKLADQLRDALVRYQPERRIGIEVSRGEVFSKALDDVDLKTVRVGEVQDLRGTIASLALFADAEVGLVFVLDRGAVVVDDPTFETMDVDAGEEMTQATVRRLLLVEFEAKADATSGDVVGVEVAATEDTHLADWTW